MYVSTARRGEDALAKPLVLVAGEVAGANIFRGYVGVEADLECERVARVTAHLEGVRDVDPLGAK
jgi:hypothetical protein